MKSSRMGKAVKCCYTIKVRVNLIILYIMEKML